MKILLVEDKSVDRMFAKHSLRQVKKLNYELVLSESLTEAKERLLAMPFDVILLDFWLPDSEGLETYHRVVSVAHNVPVIVMTATDDRALATDAIRSGAEDYLVKGAFPGSAIARVLQYAIDRYAFQRELSTSHEKFWLNWQVFCSVVAMGTLSAMPAFARRSSVVRSLGFLPSTRLGENHG